MEEKGVQKRNGLRSFYVLQSAHSWFACVYSQIATQTYVTPKHTVIETDLSGMCSL